MAKIKITKIDGSIIETQGQLTVQLDKAVDGDIVCRGSLAIHPYIEEIAEIETCRYHMKGVDVYREIFGSNDFNILYEFSLDEEDGDFIVKNDVITEIDTEKILYDMYKNEDCKRWE